MPQLKGKHIQHIEVENTNKYAFILRKSMSQISNIHVIIEHSTIRHALRPR